MKKERILLVVIGAALSGCASQGVQQLQTSDQRPCAQNFTFEGSFITGHTFKTNDFVSGVSKAEAMERGAKFTMADGWTITHTDKDLGIIGASQNVSFGQGKTAPLNIGVDEKTGGVNVNMSYSISAGVASPVEAVKDHFCSTIAAISGN